VKKIYLIEGTTGEYSDRQTWFVCAYRDKEKAYSRVSALIEKAKAAQLHTTNRSYVGLSCEDTAKRVAANFSPAEAGYVDYTGLDWTVAEVELL
jgi:hypothetical protein